METVKPSSLGTRLLAVDVETGGLNPGVSLLTAFLLIMDKDFNYIDEMELCVKPNDGIYHIEPGALVVNKIDLIEHDKTAVTESEAGRLLREFLVKNSDDGGIKLIPVGHNVAFDIRFLGDTILNKKTIDQYVSYRVMDTGVTAQLLRFIGLLPDAVKGSLESLVAYYGIDLGDNVFHTASGDVLLTVEVLKAQLKQLQGLNQPIANADSLLKET